MTTSLGPLITVRIRALAYGGSFVGDVVESPDPSLIGMRAFVPFCALGELVTAQVMVRHERYLEARLIEVLEASANRQEPPCSVYGTCGGCDIQHLELVEQRRAKRDMVISTLERQGHIAPTYEFIDLSEHLPGFEYRRRSMLHVSPSGEIGFFRPGTGDVVPIVSCPILEPSLNALLPMLNTVLSGRGHLVGSVILETGPQGRAVVVRPRAVAPSKLELQSLQVLCQELQPSVDFVLLRGERSHEIADAIGHFSQINGAGNAVLVPAVISEIKSSEVTDLYAGAGNFSLPLARRGIRLEAVELDKELVRAGQVAGQSEQLAVTFFAESVERFLRFHRCLPSVLLDPPRAGARAVAQRLTPRDNPNVVYVSCNLPSLARDLRILVERGYMVTKLKMVDMFPQTHHVELVAVLSPAG